MRLTLYLTSYCPFTKGYCFDHVGCSPDNVRDIYKDTEEYIQEAKNYDFDTISFSGGEPTYDLEKLIELIKLAKSLGFKIRIKTNAYWGENYQKYIDDLYDVGLDYIRVFYDSNRRYENKELMLDTLKAVAKKFIDPFTGQRDRQFRMIVPRGEPDYDLLDGICATVIERLPYPDSDFEFKETVSGIDDITGLPDTKIVRLEDYKFCIFWDKKVYCNGEGIIKAKHNIAINDKYVGDLNLESFEDLYKKYQDMVKVKYV